MLIQVMSTLMSIFYMMFTTFIWLLMQQNCQPGNQNLLSEVFMLFKETSNVTAINQIKLHVLSSSVMGLLSIMANASKHYHGMRVCLFLKLVLLIWGVLGLIFLYFEDFNLPQLICFSKEGSKIVSGFFAFSFFHFATTLVHIMHIKNKGPSTYRRRQLSKPKSANSPKENNSKFAPLCAKDENGLP